MSRFFFLALAAAVLLIPPSKSARAAGQVADAIGWPQFRGPDGQGHVTGPIPKSWSDTSNVAWSTDIPGKGWSSPVVLDGQVWLTTAISQPSGDMSLKLMAFDTVSGKVRHD